MSYSYQTARSGLFTDKGQRLFLAVRDNAKRLLAEAGAFKMSAAWRKLPGIGAADTWEMMACVDRLVELGELVEVDPGRSTGQDRLFVAGP